MTPMSVTNGAMAAMAEGQKTQNCWKLYVICFVLFRLVNRKFKSKKSAVRTTDRVRATHASENNK